MARKRFFTLSILLFVVLLGNSSGGSFLPRNPNYDWDIDFSILLDSYLGPTPAIWLTSQSLVYEMKTRSARENGLGPVRQGRDGEAAGSYLASLLIPQDSNGTTHGHDQSEKSGFAGDICRSLVNPRKNTTKPTIDLETLQNRVVKSIVGHGFIVETTRNLCKNLVHGIEASWENNECPWYDARLKISLDGAFQKVLSAHLTDQGIDEMRTLRFVAELETALRIVDSTLDLEGAFESLMRELMGNISTLVLRGSAEQSAAPSLREFTKLSDDAARRLPQGPLPVGTSQLRDIDNPVCIIGTFTEIAMSSLRIAAVLGGRVEVSANSATSVLDHLHNATLVCRSGYWERRASENMELRDTVTTELKNIARVVREVVDTLPPIELSRFYNWPEREGCTNSKAHARTVGGNLTQKTALASSVNLSPAPTATTLVQHKRQSFVNSLEPRRTTDTHTSLLKNSDSQPVVGYIIAMPPLVTAYHRVPGYTLDKTAYHAIPDYPSYNTYRSFVSDPYEASKGREGAVLSPVPAVPTVTSTRTIIRDFPRYTTTATISYTFTITVTSTYTNYECKHVKVR